MATFTATAAIDSYSFAGTGDDFLYFQFDAYANAGDSFDGGVGTDTLQIRSSMVARPPGGGAGFVATDEVYDFTGITFRSFEVLSFYPMARMDMPGALTFTSDQFGAGLMSNTLQLVGSDYSSTDVQEVTVNLVAGNSSFDASGWTFASYAIGTLPVTWTSEQDVIRLNGSAGNNLITGTAQSDEIDGGAGVDTVSFAALSGAVTVTLAGAQAVVAAVAGGNADTLRNVENLIGGAGADRLTGDGLANVLQGGAGADTLTGGAGNDRLNGGTEADRLIGGAGNDSYVVNTAADQIVETAGAGRDSVTTSVSWALGANLEDLTLTGTGRLAGTGNALANRLLGNGGANQLTGLQGNDSLTGGAGADGFVFTAKGFGRDTITDFVASGAGHDVLRFDDSLFATRAAALAAASQSGADVVIHTALASDSVTLKGISLASLSLADFIII